MNSESESADVFDFVDAYLRDLERGVDRPLSYWLERFPRSTDAIAREWLSLRAPPQESSGTDVGGVRGSMADGTARIGPYRLLREIGRGGQGTVFLAEDTRIARRVALKALTSRFDSITDEKRQRFRREADVIARLEHPGLCTIHDADLDGDSPWIAMRFVEGRTLGECLADAKKTSGAEVFGLRFPPRNAGEIHAVLLLVERAARALHAAHEAGVVHRDVKPGNVIVALDGRPVVLDFGLARDETSETGTLTQSGDVFGTPAYMSPEQLSSSSSDLDRRTDVYSLGATLYEALTLERPFESASRTELYRKILEAPPPDPRKLNPSLSEDVKVVLETALEKDRDRRYATALEFAEDLRRIREYEPIHARPASVGLRFARWTRRHPALAVATIGTILSLSVGLAVSLRLLANEREAVENEREARAGESKALEHALGRHLAQRAEALSLEDPPAALALGIEAVERAPNDLTRSSLFTALDACWLSRFVELEPPAKTVTAIATAPHDDRALVGRDNGVVDVVDLATARRLVALPSHAGELIEVAFDATGRRAFSASADGVIRLCDAATGAATGTFDHGEPLVDACFSSDGARVACVSAAGGLSTFDADLRERRAPEAGERRFTHAAFTRDGSILVAATRDETIVSFDALDGRRRREFACGGGIRSFVLSERDSATRLFVGCRDGALHVFDLDSGKEVGPTLRFPSSPVSIVASEHTDHAVVIVSRGEDRGDEGWAYLCDLAAGTIDRLDEHDGRLVSRAAFRPDGRTFATTSWDTTVRVWDTHSGALLRTNTFPLRQLDVAWSHDGDWILTRTNGGSAEIWYGAARPDLYDLEGHERGRAITSAAFSPDGTRALTASEDATARLWDVSSTRRGVGEIAVLRHEGPVREARFGADGTLALTSSDDGTVRVWNARTGASIRSPARHPAAVRGAVLAPTNRRFVSWSADGVVRLWDADADTPSLELVATPRSVSCAQFSPDGLEFALGGAPDEIQVRSTEDGSLSRTLTFRHRFEDFTGVVALAYRPNRDEIVAACTDVYVRAFARDVDKPIRGEWRAFSFKSLTLSEDGARALVTGRFGGRAVRSISLDTGTAVGPRISHSSQLTSACYSSDGTLVMTTSKDGTARVWSSADGAPFALREGLAESVTCGALSGRGAELRALTGGSDGRVRVWPVDPLPAARARLPRPLGEEQREFEAELARPLSLR